MTIDVRPIAPKERAMEGILYYIKSHGLKAGDRLPAERALCEELGVSRTALRAAIARLISCSTLESRQGAGTFVCPPKPLNIFQTTYSYSDAVRRVGSEPSSIVVYGRRVQADEALAAKMGLGVEDPLYEMQRVRCVDGQPSCIETTFINLSIAPDIDRGHDFSSKGLYDVLRDDYGITVEHGKCRISITRLNREEAELLHTTEGAAAFFQSDREYDANHVAVEYCKSVTLPNRYRFADNGEANGVEARVGGSWLME